MFGASSPFEARSAFAYFGSSSGSPHMVVGRWYTNKWTAEPRVCVLIFCQWHDGGTVIID